VLLAVNLYIVVVCGSFKAPYARSRVLCVREMRTTGGSVRSPAPSQTWQPTSERPDAAPTLLGETLVRRSVVHPVGIPDSSGTRRAGFTVDPRDPDTMLHGGRGVRVLDPQRARRLEFDAAVVVEPGAFPPTAGTTRPALHELDPRESRARGRRLHPVAGRSPCSSDPASAGVGIPGPTAAGGAGPSRSCRFRDHGNEDRTSPAT
jgi:hypothetical protein